jgi:Putative addiction module component
MSLMEWKEKIRELSYEEKLVLRNLLDEETHPIDPEVDQYWLEVVKQRRENIRTGKTKGVAFEDVMNEIQSEI